MKLKSWLGGAALVCLALQAGPARAWHGGCGWGWGIGIGLPPVYIGPRPWYYGPTYVYPAPVYVAPAPVVVQQAPVVSQVAPAPVAPPVVRGANAEPQTFTATSYSNPAEVDRNLQLLADPSEQVRIDAVMALGKQKVVRAVDPVAATLAGDRSPAVRDAAARALGLLGSPKGLTALKYAAQADADREVRHSAQFAVEVIQGNMKR